MSRWAVLLLLVLSGSLVCPTSVPAGDLNLPSVESDPNPHWVGWLNTFVPGSGECLLGECLRGALDATIEMGAFWGGYRLSSASPLTLDGVPEKWENPADFERGLYADLFQEFGIKFHMVNTFNVYRAAIFRARAKKSASNFVDSGQGVETESTGELFAEPFKRDHWVDPWVYIPIGISAAAFIADYFLIEGERPRPGVEPSTGSSALYAATYGAAIPIGSGAPEEMFFRGFVQNEAYHLFPSPCFAIATSTVLFAFSHQAGIERISAALSGAYLGYLAYANHGRLGPGITVHFWTDVLAGIEAFALLRRGPRWAPPVTAQLRLEF